MTGRTSRPAALSAFFAGSASLVIVLAACGADSGSTAERQSQRSLGYTGFCPDLVLCVDGLHWDTHLCRCVPGEDAGESTDGAAPGSSDGAPPPSETAVEAGVAAPDAGATSDDASEESDDTGAATDASACDGP